MAELRTPRIAVLWTRVTAGVAASLRALGDRGADVLVFRREPRAEAPFDVADLTKGMAVTAWSGAPDTTALTHQLEKFDPDAVLVCSWDVRGYRQAARRLRGRTLRILAMDNQWWGTARQWGGVALAPWLIRPTYDAALVPGERQAVFAQKLGLGVDRQILGLYTADNDRFTALAEARGDTLPPRCFLFTGRLVHDKAVDVLAAGYARYRAAVEKPWPLLVAGTGPMEDALRGVDGVELQGFVQPDRLPEVFAQAGCLVLPSRFEPWGVVLHEAAAAGLPIVCTRVCGASTRLVLDGLNGVVVAADDPADLARGLRRIHRATDEQRRAMARASTTLAAQFTPERWARNLLARIPELRRQVGLEPQPWVRPVDVGSVT